MIASLSSLFPGAWGTFASALANHLWQSTLFAAVAALLALALRNNRAHVRYWLWFTVSAKFLFPFSLLIVLGTHLASLHPIAKPIAVTNADTYFVMQEVSQPFDLATLPPPPAAPTPSPIARLRAAVGGSFIPPALAAIWLAGFLFILGRWWLRWHKIARIVRIAPALTAGREADTLLCMQQLAGLKRSISLKSLPIAIEPGIFGIFRPVLLWPAGISAHLDDAQLASVIAHEVCHVRRSDNLTAALHMAVEAIFWFHPLVWWLETRLIAERETACDQDVPALCGPTSIYARAYAESILKVCEFSIESPLPCIAGVTGADLRRRIAAIITGRALARISWPKKLMLAAAAISVTAAPIVLGQANAAHRLMLAAISAAPRPLQAAAHTMLAAEASTSSADAPEPSQSAPAIGDTAPATDDMSLGPAFEVATIRPGNRDDGRRWFGIRVDDSGHFMTSAATLNSLIVYAYAGSVFKGGVALDPQAPKWPNTDEFDINAKIDAAYMTGWDKMTDAQRADIDRPMVRRLLVDRFKLQLRTEKRDRPVYAMVQAKGGTKLKEVAAPPPPEGNEMEQMQKQMAAMRKDPAAVLPGQITCPILNEVRTCIGKAVPMSKWPGFLMGFGGFKMDRMVVDQTGLKGFYDFSFTLSTEADAASPMEQIQEQTGLRFQPSSIPVTTYVITSAEKPSLDGAEVQPTTAPTIPAKSWRFEVISIRKNVNGGPQHVGATADGWSMTNVPFSVALITAYTPENSAMPYFTPDLIIGMPDWANRERYDIVAKVSNADLADWQKPSLQPAMLRAMLSAALAERCGMAVHREKNEKTVLTLVVAKGGPHFKPADPDAKHPEGQSMNGLGTIVPEGNGSTLHFYNATMGLVATFLSRGFSVQDKTGLTGRYDFVIKRPEPPPSQPGIPTAADPQSDAATMAEELGLKLVPAKTSIETFVIDHIDHPSEN